MGGHLVSALPDSLQRLFQIEDLCWGLWLNLVAFSRSFCAEFNEMRRFKGSGGGNSFAGKIDSSERPGVWLGRRISDK